MQAKMYRILVNNRAFYWSVGIICLFFAIICYFSVAGFGRPGSHYKGKSATYDEVSHIPAGYYYLTTGKYFLNPEHPPLVKTLAALPLLALKNTVPTLGQQWEIREDGQWAWGSRFLFDSHNKTDLIVTLARASVIFFNTILLFILTLALAKLVTKRMAIVALALVVFSPLSLAHAPLVTMDFMSSILQMTTIVIFSLVLKGFKEKDNINPYMVAGFSLSLGAALLAKFSSIFLLPSLIMGGLLYLGLATGKSSFKDLLKLLTAFIVSLAASLLIVGATYALQMRNMQQSDISTQFADNWPGHLSSVSTKILNKMIHLGPLMRGWAEYTNGTFIISSVVEKSKSSVYFLSHNYGNEGAGLLYFPVLYITKMPLGFHVLTILIMIVCIKVLLDKKTKPALGLALKKLFAESPLPLLLSCFIVLYSAMALRSTLQIGVRHILPSILALSIFMAYLIDCFWSAKIYKNTSLGKASVYIIITVFATVLLAFPDYLAYYNVIAGGTANGYKVAADSNYDWGQDLKALKKWKDDNHINFAYVDVFTNPFGELEYYLGPVPKKEDYKGALIPPHSFIAISANRYAANIADSELPSSQKYTSLKPYLYKRIGQSIFIFKTP